MKSKRRSVKEIRAKVQELMDYEYRVLKVPADVHLNISNGPLREASMFRQALEWVLGER